MSWSKAFPKIAPWWSCARSFFSSVAFASLLASCALSPRIADQVEQDWKRLEEVRGSRASPLHEKIFGAGALDGRRYRKFFNDRVHEIRAEGWGFASCHGAIACHIDGDAIRLSASYDDPKIPSIIRASFFLHEAQHVTGPRHRACPDPLLDSEGNFLLSPYRKTSMSGKDACDDSLDGAYVIQFIALRNIARYCTNCSPEERQSSRDFSNYLLRLMCSDSLRNEVESDTP